MKNKGMTLFIAVIVMGILLIISFAVVNIALKSTLFASSGRDSQFAFYAADAGLECALYWDSQYDSFSTTTEGTPRTISCAGNSLAIKDAIAGTSTLTRIGGGGDAYPTSVFGFVLNSGSNPVTHCAIVTVTKYYDDVYPVGGDGFDELVTYIKSRGYNTCGSSARRIERGIEVRY